MSITAVVENDTVRLPMHLPDGTQVEITVSTAGNSATTTGSKAALLSKLASLGADCIQPGWDGEAAEPVSEEALRLASDFIRALPMEVPLPEIAAEPDGAISLDWLPARHCQFSVSVGATDRLAYAWLDGADKGHAVTRFDGLQVPARILRSIPLS